MTPRVSCEFPSNLLQTCELTYLSEYKKIIKNPPLSRIYPKISCFKIHQCSIIMLPQFNVALFETWGYYQMAIFIGFHGVLKKKLKCGNLMDIAQFKTTCCKESNSCQCSPGGGSGASSSSKPASSPSGVDHLNHRLRDRDGSIYTANICVENDGE